MKETFRMKRKENSCINTGNKLTNLPINLGMVNLPLSSEGKSMVSDNQNFQQPQHSPAVVKCQQVEEESGLTVLLKAKLNATEDQNNSNEYLTVKKTKNKHQSS